MKSLYEDILINVTSFFREPEAFEALKRLVFPEIMRNRGADEPIRIWVPGCATGEEAYSLAISLLEYLGDRPTTSRSRSSPPMSKTGHRPGPRGHLPGSRWRTSRRRGYGAFLSKSPAATR